MCLLRQDLNKESRAGTVEAGAGSRRRRYSLSTFQNTCIVLHMYVSTYFAEEEGKRGCHRRDQTVSSKIAVDSWMGYAVELAKLSLHSAVPDTGPSFDMT